MKKFGAVLLCVCLTALAAFGVVACAKDKDKEQPKQPIDNTAASLVHDPLYYYEEDNVPFDDDNDCYAFCFLTPYLAAKPTGGAVVIFPGGGYNHLSNSTQSVSGYGQGVDNAGNQKEASAIAKWYNAVGISVFIANYRTTAVDSSVCYKHILSDGLRAVRYVRAHADSFYVDTDKIAVQGWSAGGHLASMLLTKYDWSERDGNYLPDAVDSLSAEPNAGVLCYAVISMQTGLTHNSTRAVFTGGNSSLYDVFSAEKNVSSSTAPCFLWCHLNDRTVSSANTSAFAEALTKAGVENEVHIYDDGGTTAHGVGTAQDYAEAKEWPTLATQFLQDIGF